jgi:hypothetical protein
MDTNSVLLPGLLIRKHPRDWFTRAVALVAIETHCCVRVCEGLERRENPTY